MSEMPERVLVVEAKLSGIEWRGYAAKDEPETWGQSEHDVFYIRADLAAERERELWEAVKANHQHHLEYGEDYGYEGSELHDLNVAALTKIDKDSPK